MSNSLLISALRSAGLVHSYATIEGQEEGVVDTRDLGQWKVPDGEQDDGDYDWEIPTEATFKKINEIAKTLGWGYIVGEKNWITFEKKD